MFNCNSKPVQGGKNGPWLHKVYMMSQSNRGSICRALSQILLLPRRKPYFSSATSPCETTRLQPGGGLCLYKREMGAVSEWVSEEDVLPPLIPPPPLSVCLCGAEAAVWFDVLPRWPQCVYSSYSAVSKGHRKNSHSQKAVFWVSWHPPCCFCGSACLLFFPTSKLVCVLEHRGLTIFLFHLVPLSLSLGRCSLSTLTSFPRLASSPCCLPSSRQNQLKDQAQQALVSPGQLPEEAECLTVPKYKRDLVQKLKILRQELSQQQPQAGHCRIEVSREEIFEVRMEKKKQAQSCHHIVWSSQRVALIKDTAKWVHNLTPREIQLSEPEHAWNKLKCMTMKNMELM